MRFVTTSLPLFIASLAVASPAWAGINPTTPGPLVGAGIPALLGLTYVYRRIRKSRG